jgi:hypothetical protein
MLAGAWRVLAAAPELMAKGSAIGMSFPRRMIIAHADDWRDHACVATPAISAIVKVQHVDPLPNSQRPERLVLGDCFPVSGHRGKPGVGRSVLSRFAALAQRLIRSLHAACRRSLAFAQPLRL